MKTVLITHQDNDLNPTEKLHDHKCWTGAKLASDYFFLVWGKTKEDVVERCIVGDPRRAVEKAWELSSKSRAYISLANWPKDEYCLSTQPVREIFGNLSDTDFRVQTDDFAYSYCDHDGDACDQSQGFLLLYSGRKDATSDK